MGGQDAFSRTHIPKKVIIIHRYDGCFQGFPELTCDLENAPWFESPELELFVNGVSGSSFCSASESSPRGGHFFGPEHCPLNIVVLK